MLITPAAIQTLQTTFSTQFHAAYGRAETTWQNYATMVPSSTRQNDYGWMAKIPALREWLGPRVIQNLSSYHYQLTNRHFELTIGVDRDDIEDDNLGVYGPLFESMGEQAAMWPDDLAVAALEGGGANLGFDGVSFFNAAHPSLLAGGAAVANDFPATPLTAANYEAVRSAMSTTFIGEDGRPLGVRPNLLVVPPALERTARTILEAELIPSDAGTSPQTNVLRNTATVLVMERLQDPGQWYLMDTRRPIKPLIYQLRRAPELNSKTAPTDDNTFWDNQFIWGIDARGGAVGYSLWFLAARAN